MWIKPFWESGTIWINLGVGVVLFFLAEPLGIPVKPVVVGLVGMNIILRFLSSYKVTLF